MTGVLGGDRDDIDVAFAGNRLLATLPEDARALLEPQASIVHLSAGDLVLRRGVHVDSTLFPVGPMMVSMVVELSGGRSIQVASIGREGAIGGIVSCGHAPAFSETVVLVDGAALKLPMAALEQAKRDSRFVGNLFCRYSDYLLSQVMQTVACNAYHSIAARAAQWLLVAQDRAGDRIELTQEAFAGLLGVQRTTVNAVIRTLQDEGLIQTGRGVVRILDRAGLRARACECYDALESHFANVIGAGGTGGSIGCD